MRFLAVLTSLWIVAIGACGVLAPDTLVAAARQIVTPFGLYVLAAVRVAMGFVWMMIAPHARATRVVRVFGFAMIAAGLATPVIGVDRTIGVIDWASAQGPACVRAFGVFALAIGGFIGFVVLPRR